MSDFDGTLAPIVSDPNHAYMRHDTRRLLIRCARKFPVIIISGRALSDVERRVGIPGLWYAGNHGLEWHFGRVRGRLTPPPSQRQAFIAARSALLRTVSMHEGAFIEDKGLSLGVHFRNVRHSKQAALRRAIRATLTPFKGQGVAYEEGEEYIFNVRPRFGYDKGDLARFARSQFPKRLIPIFIGDDENDEPAFRALKSGITIRVGKTASAARYYFPRQSAVDHFLRGLASLTPSNPVARPYRRGKNSA